MGIVFVLKSVVKRSVSNSRYLFRKSSSIEFNPSLYIPKRHFQHSTNGFLEEKKLPLVRRLYGNDSSNNDDGVDKVNYFSLLSNESLSPVKQLHLPFPKIGVISSCDGVLCLEGCTTSERRIFLWNPSTNDIKFIPQSSSIQCPPSAEDMTLCDCALGFDVGSQDYKVVRFVHIAFETKDGYYHHTDWHVELYSLKSDSWEQIADPPYFNLWRFGSTYVNGVFYWAVYGREQEEILSFDFANRKFSSFGIPESGKRLRAYHIRLLEWDGMLAAIIYPRHGAVKSFDLWVRDNGSWIRVSAFPISGAVRPLGFWTKDHLVFEGIDHDLNLFDLATREVNHTHIYDYPKTLEFILCVESRVQLKSGSENKEPSKGEAFR